MALAAASPARAQEPQLGTIDFPTSAGPAAQAAFVRGVLYLHSFEYASSATAFREAQGLDPGFAMAYWGEAMSLNHPIWNEQDSVQARTLLDRLAPSPEARQAKAPTARERGYLQAVEQLYGAGGSKPRRDTLYSAAMESLAAAYPADAEARAFYALSLLGLSQGDRVVPTYMRAGAISLALLQQYPDHPGAAHYAIHSFDDPDHAIIGLPAARAYSRIAPGAPHAQHMTAHIFLALGMWNEVVSQNVIASGPDRSKWTPGHYTQWLQYGLLQLGRAAEADSLLRTSLATAGTPLQGGRASYALEMRAAQIVNAQQWREPYLSAPLAVSRTSVGSEAADAFAQGYAALQRGEPGTAATQQERFPALTARVASRPDATQPGTVAALAKALDAAVAFQAGRRDEALVLIAEANHIEDGLTVEFGPPTIVKPTWELRGEMLLAMNRPREAQDAFTRSLALQPNRLLSMQGLAAAERALAMTGHSGE
jgi:tetratricopeptide (TPR) repeat protein